MDQKGYGRLVHDIQHVLDLATAHRSVIELADPISITSVNSSYLQLSY